MKLVVSLSGGGDTRGWLWWFGGFLKSHHLDLVVYYLSCPGSIFLGCRESPLGSDRFI